MCLGWCTRESALARGAREQKPASAAALYDAPPPSPPNLLASGSKFGRDSFFSSLVLRLPMVLVIRVVAKIGLREDYKQAGDGTEIAIVDAQRSALMPAISGSIFRRTLRDQHLAQEYKADTSTAALHTYCAPSALRHNESAAYSQSPRIAVPRRVAHPRVGAARAVRQAGEHADPRLACPLRLRGGSSSAATGTPRWSVGRVLIPTTSARKKAVTKQEGASRLSSTTVLYAAHAHCAAETLDESAVSPHGAERAHTHDWPARRGYEVRELERDVDVFALALTPSSRLYSCSDSYDRIRMTGIGIGSGNRRTDGADDGYARAWTGGDGEKERERDKGKRRRAEHDVREEGRSVAGYPQYLIAPAHRMVYPLCDERGEKLAQTRDWHTCRSYEVQELGAAIGAIRRCIRVCVTSSGRARLPCPAFGFLQPDHEDGIGMRVAGRCKRRRVRLGTDGRRWTEGDGWKEGAGAGAGQRQTTAGREREEGRSGLFVLSKRWGRGVVGGDVGGMEEER
ncbi:hypothetical protein B0H13DRAFT_2669050 [Mycena leptocephala]|nr:hypothetical protein B0H13DRAFT_2669050 [Mycena leptocephala]